MLLNACVRQSEGTAAPSARKFTTDFRGSQTTCVHKVWVRNRWRAPKVRRNYYTKVWKSNLKWMTVIGSHECILAKGFNGYFEVWYYFYFDRIIMSLSRLFCVFDFIWPRSLNVYHCFYVLICFLSFFLWNLKRCIFIFFYTK